MRSGLLAAATLLMLVTACDGEDSTALETTPATGGLVPSTTVPSTTAPSTTAPSTTALSGRSSRNVPLRADGCAERRVELLLMDERLADVDGDGRDDLVRTHQETPPLAPRYDAVLQVVFADGRFSAPTVVGTPKLLADLDLDGDGRSEILVADIGNTAQGGGVYRLRDCAMVRVAQENGDQFIFTFWATGLGCAPVCYPSVECQRSGTEVDLVTMHAGWQPPTLRTLPPPPSDDLPYWWQIERWRLRDGVMVRIEWREGTARHADLPVPKRQGIECAV